ncbi:Aspartate aminotransferase [Enterobacter hormaechei]|nr:Aspartate aminotransferase [Enterobacter hormaechei]
MIISSFGKTYHVTGWRVGYCVAPAELMDEICKVHQFLMFSADTPMQYAFAEHMTDPQTWLSLAAFLSAQARSAAKFARRLTVQAATKCRFVLPAGGLQRL